jgi:4-amino-4-deoxy-L-arabinose transferase-like glycosyltransferase
VFNQDEMVLGYDAWSVWQTGRDHHGEWLPINFRTFNDYVPPVANYITAPFVGLLGLSEATTRLPFAVLGIATVLLTALLGRRWFGDAAGLLAALFLTVDPWPVNYSRVALPTSIVPFFTVAALYTFTRATDRLRQTDDQAQRPDRVVIGWFALSVLCFALLTGSYSTMKLQGPLLVLIGIVAAFPLLRKHRLLSISWLVGYALLVSPLAITVLQSWNTLQMRFQEVGAFDNIDWPVQAARLYLDHFNPGALVFSGFGAGVGVRPPFSIGELFWLEVPLWVAAFVGLARGQAARRAALSVTVLVCLWFIAYPVADSLTDGDRNGTIAGGPHELRSIDFLPLPELLAGFGAVFLWRELNRYGQWGRISALGLGLAGSLVLVVFAVTFFSYFFGPPFLATNQADLPFNIGLRPMLDVVTERLQPCDVVWMEPGNQAYIYYLFLTRYPPSKAQQMDFTQTYDRWLHIDAFDQVHFGTPPDPEHLTVAPGCTAYHAYMVARSPITWPGWSEIASVKNAAGRLVWHVMIK